MWMNSLNITISEEECSQAIELMGDIVTKLKLLIE